MNPRSATLRWMIWACSWALVLLISRSASAEAPMCDERGASAIAPPPVLQARDVKIDSGSPFGCEAPLPPRAAFAPRNGSHPQPVANDAGFADTWVRPSVPRLPHLPPRHALDGSTALLAASLGYGPHVFRPPRA